jgi:hypothetical protein
MGDVYNAYSTRMFDASNRFIPHCIVGKTDLVKVGLSSSSLYTIYNAMLKLPSPDATTMDIVATVRGKTYKDLARNSGGLFFCK